MQGDTLWFIRNAFKFKTIHISLKLRPWNYRIANKSASVHSLDETRYFVLIVSCVVLLLTIYGYDCKNLGDDLIFFVYIRKDFITKVLNSNTRNEITSIYFVERDWTNPRPNTIMKYWMIIVIIIIERSTK